MKARISGRGRLFIGFTAVLLVFVFVLFQTTQQQVDRCERQENALRTRFDSQAESIAALQQSVEAGRRSGDEMKERLQEEKVLREKAVKDAASRVASLQQQYQSLQKEYEDSKKVVHRHETRIKDLESELAREKRDSADKLRRAKSEISALSSKCDDSGKIKKLMQELALMRDHCSYRVEKEMDSSPAHQQLNIPPAEVQRSFAGQVQVSGNTYEIPVTLGDTPNNKLILPKSTNRTLNHRWEASPTHESAAVIISRDTFQISPQSQSQAHAQEPLKAHENKVSTPTLQKAEQPLKVAPAPPTKSHKVPFGVVPIPEERVDLPQDHRNIRGDQLMESEGMDKAEDSINFLQNGNEVENGAHEDIVEDRIHQDHMQEALDLVVNHNNAAEEEADDNNRRNDLDLAVINRDREEQKDAKKGVLKKKTKKNEDFEADQGFDDHMEEHIEEEDDGEYPNLAQQEEGPAIRN